jgi:hypothetical protein
MREAYRRQHPGLVAALPGHPGTLTLALVFRGETDTRWADLSADAESLVRKLTTELS